MKNTMKNTMKSKHFILSLKKEYSILIAWFVFVLLLITYLFFNINIRSDISFFLPKNSTAEQNIMQYQLTHGEAGKILLIALSAQQSKVPLLEKQQKLSQANKKLHQILKQNKNFTQVQNGQSDQKSLIIEPFYRYRYLLNYDSLNNKTLNKKISNEFSKTQLDGIFKQVTQRLQLIINPFEQKLLAEDPSMRWLSLLKSWQSSKLKKLNQVWFDMNGEKTLLFVKTQADGFDLEQQQLNLETIKKSIQQLSSDGFSIESLITGAPVFALASKQSIRQQSTLITTTASVILMAFLFWFFRSVKIVLLSAIPLGLAILTGIACVLFFDGFIHGITIAFGITIIGIAVDYPIHLYTHSLSKQNNHASLVQSMQTIWPMIRLGLITSIIGFSAILWSDFSGLQQLGIFAISGLLMAAFSSRFLLAYINIKQYKSSISNSQLSSLPSYVLLAKIIQYSNFQYRRPFALILVILACIYIFYSYDRIWENDLSALSPISSLQKQQDFQLRKAMGIPDLRYAYIINADNIESLLQQSEALIPKLNQQIKQGAISGYDMAARYLPSVQWQKSLQQQLPDQKTLQYAIQQSLQHSDLNSLAFNPFIQQLIISKQLKPLVLSDLDKQKGSEHNLIVDKIHSLLFQDQNHQWTAIVPLQGVQNTKFAPLQIGQSDDNNLVQSLHLLDLKQQSEQMLKAYRSHALNWFFYGLLFIIIILLWTTQSIKALIPLVFPFVAAVLLTISSLLLMGYSLSIFHLVTLLLVVGLGIDYSIFTFFLPKDSQNSKQSRELALISVIICMCSTIIMFGSLGLSDLPVLKAIGLTASLGAAYAFLLTFLTIKTPA